MIDLHCHSDCSDGTLSAPELVNLAASLGLEALAITDHDTLEGYDLARSRAVERRLELLCGIEIATRFPGCSGSTHLLGYFLNGPGNDFREWILRLQESRNARNQELLQRLNQQGIRITWEQLQAQSTRQLGRPHFARVMVRQGYVRTLKEAFDLYLAESGSAWTERDEPLIEEAIQRIRGAGGVASLAHPVRISRDMNALRVTVASLASVGLAALECYHVEHSAEEVSEFLHMASANGLAVTGGSDFHGQNKPGIQLGTGTGTLHVPYSLLAALKSCLGVQRAKRDAAAVERQGRKL